MSYKLSNIARSCLSLNGSIPNIVYFPNRSIVDSLINNIASIRTITPSQYWSNDIQAIMYNIEDANSYDNQELIKYYHSPIIQLSDNENSTQNPNIYNVSYGLSQYLNQENIKPLSEKKDKILAYILDTDTSKPDMIVDFLKSTGIEFSIIDSNQFIDSDPVQIGQVLSGFKIVLNNTSLSNLIFSYLVGSTPVTFRRDLVESSKGITKLVTDIDFVRVVSDLVSKTNDTRITPDQIQQISLSISHSLTQLTNNFVIL